MTNLTEMVEAVRGHDIKPVPETFRSLESMVKEGFHYARSMLVGDDPQASLQPSWNLVSNRGQVTMMVTPFGQPESKDAIGYMVRTLINAAEVVRYSFVCEAWLAMPVAGDLDDRPPSQRDDRIEVVMITAADREKTLTSTYEIVRGDRGQVVDLTLRWETGGDETSTGRFSNMFDEEEA